MNRHDLLVLQLHFAAACGRHLLLPSFVATSRCSHLLFLLHLALPCCRHRCSPSFATSLVTARSHPHWLAVVVCTVVVICRCLLSLGHLPIELPADAELGHGFIHPPGTPSAVCLLLSPIFTRLLQLFVLLVPSGGSRLLMLAIAASADICTLPPACGDRFAHPIDARLR